MQLQQSARIGILQPSRFSFASLSACHRPCRASKLRTAAQASPSRSSLDSAGALHHPKQHHQLHDPWPIAAAATAPSGIRSPDTATDDFDSTPRAVSLSTTATEVKLQQESFKGFEWLSHWYPVHVVDQLNPSRPHAVELLGKQLVLWRDSQGIWSCFDNACPHRLAPLSEGRIADDGTLMCSYHGWKFSGDGACVDIPQALDEKSKSIACSSKRSCAVQYPTQQAYGLVWVWPIVGTEAAAEAGASPVPLSPAVKSSWDSGKGIKWFRRELEYSYDILVENLVDPAHVPWAHHQLNPTIKREMGGPMTYRPIQLDQQPRSVGADGDTVNSSSKDPEKARPMYWHADTNPLGAFDYGTAMAPAGAQMAFTPPCSSTCQYQMGPNRLCRSELLAVPRGPGKSVAITMLEMTDVPKVTAGDVLKALVTKPGQAPAFFQRLRQQDRPLYEDHLQANMLFDQDMVFLNKADRFLTQRGKSSWARSYYMPTPSDSAVIAARRWFDKSLQLPLDPKDPASPPASSIISLTPLEASSPASPRQQQMDRYSQHTKHCIICQQALQKLQKQLGILMAVSGVLRTVAVCLGAVGAVLLFHLVPMFGPRTYTFASVGEAFMAMLLTYLKVNSMVLAGIAAVVLGAAAAACARWAMSIQKKLQKFVYVDFYHADNN